MVMDDTRGTLLMVLGLSIGLLAAGATPAGAVDPEETCVSDITGSLPGSIDWLLENVPPPEHCVDPPGVDYDFSPKDTQLNVGSQDGLLVGRLWVLTLSYGPYTEPGLGVSTGIQGGETDPCLPYEQVGLGCKAESVVLGLRAPSEGDQIFLCEGKLEASVGTTTVSYNNALMVQLDPCE